MAKLSDPITIRNMVVKNRIGYPAMMSNCSNPDGSPSERNISLYEQKAKGGIGILTYEAVNVNPMWIGSTQPNVGRVENIPKFKELTERVHKHGAKIGVQIQHPGVLMYMGTFGTGAKMPILAPSKVDPKKAFKSFRSLVPDWDDYLEKNPVNFIPLTKEMIIGVQNDMTLASKNAIEAGFDYVEIHSAHGTLYHDFVDPFYNRREDEYGGSHEKRITLIKETVQKMRKVMDDKPIFVRISGDTFNEDGIQLNDAIITAKLLEKDVGVDLIDVTAGVIVRNAYGILVPSYFDRGCFMHLAEGIKKEINLPVMGVGRINTPKLADQYIQEGRADIINFGRQSICDPEFANKYFAGRSDDIKSCFACGISCGTGACVYDPYSGPFLKEIVPTEKPKKIVILGGGIAGMEATRISKIRGHYVDLFEKTNSLGGLMPLVAAEYKKEEYLNISNWLEGQLNKMEVSIHLNRELSKNDIKSMNPDVLAFAIGTKASVPVKFEGNPNVLTQDEAILKSKPLGKDVVIWGLDTYWRGGAETAITLIEQGYNVKALIGKEKAIAGSIRTLSGRYLWIWEYLVENKKIPIHYGAKLEDFTDEGVVFTDSEGNVQVIKADTLVYCGSRLSARKTLEKEFEGVAPEIVFLGDCKAPRDIREAMKDAHNFARNI